MNMPISLLNGSVQPKEKLYRIFSYRMIIQHMQQAKSWQNNVWKYHYLSHFNCRVNLWNLFCFERVDTVVYSLIIHMCFFRSRVWYSTMYIAFVEILHSNSQIDKWKANWHRTLIYTLISDIGFYVFPQYYGQYCNVYNAHGTHVKTLNGKCGLGRVFRHDRVYMAPTIFVFAQAVSTPYSGYALHIREVCAAGLALKLRYLKGSVTIIQCKRMYVCISIWYIFQTYNHNTKEPPWPNG